jgi:hypothetical protein
MEFTVNLGIITGIGGFVGLIVGLKVLGFWRPWFVKNAKAEDVEILRVQLDDHSIRVEKLDDKIDRMEGKIDTIVSGLHTMQISCVRCKPDKI